MSRSASLTTLFLLIVAYLLRLFFCHATTNQPDTPLFSTAQTPDSVKIPPPLKFVKCILRYHMPLAIASSSAELFYKPRANVVVMSKIIFVNRFFYPDHSATSQLLTDLVSKLDVTEKEIHIITSRLKYDDESTVLSCYENWQGIYIHRCWTSRFGRAALIGRSVDYLTYYVSSFSALLRLTAKNDIVVAKTDPPLISVICAVVVKLKKAILINWIQDLFPEVARELGVTLFKGYAYKIIKYVRNWSLKVARFNVVLGVKMAELINQEIHLPDSTIIVPNWVVGESVRPIARENNKLRKEWGVVEKFVVGYSGNLGRAHDVETLYESMHALKDESDIVFIFIGGGAGYEKIKSRASLDRLGNVIFKPYQNADTLSCSLSLPDVHVISLIPGLEGLIVPSKLYGVLSVARPIIFIGDEGGEIASVLKRGKCGTAVASGDSISFVKNVIRLKSFPEEYNVMSKNAFSLFRNNYNSEKSIERWRSILSNA